MISFNVKDVTLISPNLKNVTLISPNRKNVTCISPNVKDVTSALQGLSHGAAEVLDPVLNVRLPVKDLDEVEVAVVGLLQLVGGELTNGIQALPIHEVE